MDTQFQLSLESESSKPVLPISILPADGEALYHGCIFSNDVSEKWLSYLLNEIPWKRDVVVMYGKTIETSRKVAWFGDRAFDYRYSGRVRTALVWTDRLRELKRIVEENTGESFNSCLLNLYADGDQGMSWHSDDEKELEESSAIASLSFGAERRFDFRRKSDKLKVSVQLGHGSLLVMKGETQKYWQHQIPKTKKVHSARVNLTFRKMREV
ncbi:alpha-ketoglutarate-dependent dioxygenase AlkB family protein [Pelagicoccus albus]|uniref:Alpha-ketoglutarate-dependent dioxygenase AlkB n=1 Tax=Pelagicoccus albus TaxID=415222 RepID=A0A7X1B9C7_9BACT|nr:alpha-ketoglutarate-dependent dioxygenase AlkB [Pelagicoccus albus]MBC2608095.1 alpha-ketoglutarate-dependent dioxygenase AlkB [Pelagicoccus albus]